MKTGLKPIDSKGVEVGPIVVLILAGWLGGCAIGPALEKRHDRSDESIAKDPGGVRHRWQQRAGADGRIAVDAIWQAKMQADALRSRREANPGVSFSEHPGGIAADGWQWLGPGNVGGRVLAIATHPSNPGILWIGAASGGVWKSSDAGETWRVLDDFLGSLAIGCLAVDRKNPDVIYAGTGEGIFDVPSGSTNTAAVGGAGVFRSTDGGERWARLDSTSGEEWSLVNRLAISPDDSSVILAATGSGIFRTTDGGASWSRRTTDRTLDLRIHPTDGAKGVAGRADGIALYTVDGGLTWTAATGTSGTRVELTYSPSDPQTVFAGISRIDSLNSTVKVYRSTNGGQSYSLRTASSALYCYALYDNTIWVDPTNPQTVVVGGYGLYLSTDGGGSFSSIGEGHVDLHSLVESSDYDGAAHRTLFVGNDGGVYVVKSLGPGVSAATLNHNLGITQFYGAAVGPTGVVLAGAQDNSSQVFTGDPQGWRDVIGGDGGYCAADPTDPKLLYGGYYDLNLYRSRDGGLTFKSYPRPPESDPNFISYFALDPNQPKRMLAAGGALWRSDNIRDNVPAWNQIKAPVVCPSPSKWSASGTEDPGHNHFFEDQPCNVSTFTVTAGDSDVIWVGHNNGDVFVSSGGTSASPVWVKVDDTPVGLPGRWVSSIAIDPNDPLHVYVSFLGYENHNVWKTRDGGASWVDAGGASGAAIPAIPVNAIAVHPMISGLLYAGTDIGLFVSEDDGASWTPAEGPANVDISQLVWKTERTLMVVTYGRGIYYGTVARDCWKTVPESPGAVRCLDWDR